MADEKPKRANGAKVPEEVVHEYAAIGKYRVRVVRNPSRRSGGTVFDVREYISSDTFEGFTRKGVRFGSLRDLQRLGEAIRDAGSHGWFEENSNGKADAA